MNKNEENYNSTNNISAQKEILIDEKNFLAQLKALIESHDFEETFLQESTNVSTSRR